MRIRDEIRKYATTMLFSFFCALLVDLIALVPPLVMRHIIDVEIPNGALNRIMVATGVFVVLPILSGSLYAVYNYWGAMTCRKASFVINSDIIDRIMGQPMRFHIEKNSSTLAAECSRSAIDYAYLWVNTIPQTAATLVTAFVALGYLWNASHLLALSQLLLIPVLTLPTLVVKKIVQSYSKILFGAVNAIQAMLIESFRGIKAIKTLGIEAKVLDQYRNLYNGASRYFGRGILIESFQGSVATQFLMAVFVGIAFVISAIGILQGDMTVGILVSSLAFITKYQNGIYGLMSANLNFGKQLATFEPLFQYRTLPKETDIEGESPKGFLDKELRVSHLSFRYNDEREILHDVNLVVPKGEWTGICGTSGIGKTTLLDLVTRIERPADGTLLLDGQDVNTLRLDWYRSHIAVVQQFPFLFHDTIRNNFLHVNPQASDLEIREALDAVALGPLMDTLAEGLDHVFSDDAQDVSGGEKQRFAMAMAILSGRKFLVLDEATSSVDEATETLLCRKLHELVADKGYTILSVSHRENFHAFCDNVIRLVGSTATEQV